MFYNQQIVIRANLNLHNNRNYAIWQEFGHRSGDNRSGILVLRSAKPFVSLCFIAEHFE